MTSSSPPSLPQPPPGERVLDEAALDRLRQLDPEGRSRLLPRVLGTYAASLTKLLAQLQVARDAGDMAGVHMAVHTLKSSSSSVGALALSAFCANAEIALRDQRFDALPPLLTQLQAEALQVDAAVQQLLAQTK